MKKGYKRPLFSEEWKINMSNSHKGKKHSEETRKKMSETAKRIGKGKWFKGRMGKNSNAWKGGYRIKRNERNDSLYQLWVYQVKKRDNNNCVFKGQDCSGYNIVHHILSWRDYPELRYNINNGITLCQTHHPLKRAEEKLLIPIFVGLIRVS